MAFQLKKAMCWKRLSIAAMAMTMMSSGIAPVIPSMTPAATASERQQGWNAALKVARLVQTNQLVLQMNVLNKPVTSYANAVYMVYARRNSQWVQVYTSQGARLIASGARSAILEPEVISISDLERQLGTDLSNVELKAVAQLRYDMRGERRDQRVEFEQVQNFSTIAQTTTTQLFSTYSASQVSTTQTTTASAQPVVNVTNTSIRQEQSRFGLTIVQRSAALKEVIARVSLKPRQANGFLAEQFIGDFKYKLSGKKQKAKFIKGLKAGDRAIVRLFTKDNRFIGYSEFELLASGTAVTLVLPDRPADYGVVRTVYGVDANDDFVLDRNTKVYDYFTQVTQVQDFRQAQVTFLSSVQTLSSSVLRAFSAEGLPALRRTCVYPSSFVSGSYSLVSQVVQAFSSSSATAITALPGQVVQVINISSTTNISTYEVSQLIVNYQQVGVTQGTVIRGDDDDNDDDRKPRKKRNCNQGRGNGSEGCDPGNSRPHGGSNDGD